MAADIKFDMPKGYEGEGVSSGLERGLLVRIDGRMVVGEGMGIGICAAQKGDYTYFSSISNVEKDEDKIRVEYSIDKRLMWKVAGFKSHMLTKILERFATDIYMKFDRVQRALLLAGDMLRRVFRVGTSFEKVEPLARVLARYEINDGGIKVNMRILPDVSGLKLFVMNELSGKIFSGALKGGVNSAPPSGWVKRDSECKLWSEEFGIIFSAKSVNTAEGVESEEYWGREVARGYDWAGFESMIRLEDEGVKVYEYEIEIRGKVGMI